MKRLLCLAVFLFFMSVQGAFCCDRIRNWATEDVQAFATDLRLRVDLTVVSNEPQMRSSDQNVSTLLIVRGFRDKDVAGETYTWDISISIRSYSDSATANDEFSRFSFPPGSTPTILTQDPLAYYNGLMVDGFINNFELHGHHLNSVIHVHASQMAPLSGDRVVTPAEFNELFLALFARAKGLIDGKCSVSGPGNPPRIFLEIPQERPGKYPLEFSILEGKGFWFSIEDQDGVYDGQTWKIDLGSIRVETDGTDVTDEFLLKAVPCKADAKLTGTKVSVLIKPDPKLFMTDHNMFDIRVNGEHRLTLRVCDTDGQCGYAEYLVYFGPVVRFEEDSSGPNLKVGNVGYETSCRWFLVHLDAQGKGKSFTAKGWTEGLIPVLADPKSVTSGIYGELTSLASNLETMLRDLEPKHLYMAVLDVDTGEFAYDRIERID